MKYLGLVFLLSSITVDASSLPAHTGIIEIATCRTTTTESVGGAVIGQSVGSYVGESLFGGFGRLAGGVAGGIGGSKVLASSETGCTLLIKTTIDNQHKYVLANTKDREYNKGEVVKLHIVGDMAILLKE